MTTTPREFQIATVEAAIASLKSKGRRRFLVADEVGLGKTVVAREVLRKLSDEGNKPFIVYYITSNTKVSDQNAKRLLDFLGEEAKAAVSSVDRLGLIPLEGRKRPGVRLYPLAPLTSFPPLTTRPQTGKVGERAFIACMLERCYLGLEDELPAGFMQQRARASWPGALKNARASVAELPTKFINEYRSALVREFGHNARKKIVTAAGGEKKLLALARLRRPLAEASLLATPPDLIIFDEFQRYRELLKPTKEDRLVQALLDGKSGRGPAMILLSATPYRLYSDNWEGTQNQPHEELFDIIEFLGGRIVRGEAATLFERFGAILRRIGRTAGDTPDPTLVEHALAVRHDIQTLLRPIMARTERQDPADLNWEGTHHPEHSLHSADLQVFKHFAEGISSKLKSAALPYWLSVPLPAQSLGSRYKIATGVEFKPARSVPALTAARRPGRSGKGWGSAKLRALLDVSSVDQLALPWVAPSLSWWPLTGGWAETPSPKLLLFSRFRATPQSIAGLTSLEVESRYAAAAGVSYERAWLRRKLQAKASQGATLALFHPSAFLIRETDPLKGRFSTPALAKLTVKLQLAKVLRVRGISIRTRPKSDAKRRLPTWQVLAAVEKASGDFEAAQSLWTLLASEDGALAELLAQRADVPALEWLSPRELSDLADVALGGPAIAVGRAWLRHYDQALARHGQNLLIRFCWQRLRNYLDNPVFWGRLGANEKPTRVLQRAIIGGGFESLLDEHFWLARARVAPAELIQDLHDAFAASSGWFTFKSLPVGPGGIRVRCHAAVPFGGTDASEDPLSGDDHAKPVRSQELRRAFNAPFWPHILATTSVGQEGLDFHTWCDRIAHWDLPSNPVDLEQREGRISRFGGLVVRRPLARSVGPAALTAAASHGGSPWCHLEGLAEEQHRDPSGLSPWWLLKGAAIKRYVFSLPQSRDLARFRRLRRQRLLYRLALGQPNQEDLVDLLMTGGEDRAAALSALTLDFAAFRPSAEAKETE